MPSPAALPHGVRFGAQGSQLRPPPSFGALPARSHQRRFPKEGHPDFKEKTPHDESKGVDGAVIYNPALGRAPESCQHPEDAPLIPSKKLQCLLLELGSLGHRVLLLGQPAAGGSSDAERHFWTFCWGTAALLGAEDIPASPLPLLDASLMPNTPKSDISHAHKVLLCAEQSPHRGTAHPAGTQIAALGPPKPRGLPEGSPSEHPQSHPQPKGKAWWGTVLDGRAGHHQQGGETNGCQK